MWKYAIHTYSTYLNRIVPTFFSRFDQPNTKLLGNDGGLWGGLSV